MAMMLTSPAFAHQAPIPSEFTCEGQDISPPLAWSGEPAGTKSFVLIVDDPDAPDPNAPRTIWVHWLVYNLPASVNHLPENIDPRRLPAGTKVGINDWGRQAYGGPCPPIGQHRYFHKLYALDTVLGVLDHPTKANLEIAMRGHILAEATLIGTYRKSR